MQFSQLEKLVSRVGLEPVSNRTRNVFKKTNGVGLKKTKIKHKVKYLNINLTQMTENLK